MRRAHVRGQNPVQATQRRRRQNRKAADEPLAELAATFVDIG
jgi:hypothetical protein